MSDNSSYTDLAQRIEESFAEIEDEAISDFRETDEEYNALYQQILRLKENNPFIRKVIDGNGEISLSAEEHGVLTEYFRLRFRLDDMERQRLYFRGHTTLWRAVRTRNLCFLPTLNCSTVWIPGRLRKLQSITVG